MLREAISVSAAVNQSLSEASACSWILLDRRLQLRGAGGSKAGRSLSAGPIVEGITRQLAASARARGAGGAVALRLGEGRNDLRLLARPIEGEEQSRS